MTDKDRIVIYPNKIIQLISIILWLTFAYLLIQDIEELWYNGDVSWVILYNLGLGYALYDSIKSIRALILNKPYFSIDADGFHSPKFGLIPWKDIKEIKFNKTFSSTASCYVFVNNPETYINKFEGFEYSLLEQLHIEKGTPIWITFPLATLKKTKIDALIQTYMQK